MSEGVVLGLAGYDRHIGLGLGLLVERQRTFLTDVPARPEGGDERSRRLADRRVVPGALPLRAHELATDELQSLARRNHARIDELLELSSCEASRPDLAVGHRADRSDVWRVDQCPGLNTLGEGLVQPVLL